jgi:hypothetical protein
LPGKAIVPPPAGSECEGAAADRVADQRAAGPDLRPIVDGAQQHGGAGRDGLVADGTATLTRVPCHFFQATFKVGAFSGAQSACNHYRLSLH